MTVTARLENIEKKLDHLNNRLFVDQNSLCAEVGRNKGRIMLLRQRISIPAMVLSILSACSTVVMAIYTIIHK